MSEANVAERLSLLLRTGGVRTVVDVGANVGQFAMSIRAAGFDGRIVSFEPASAAFAALTLASQEDDGWECHQIALGEVAQHLDLNLSANSVSSSFLELESFTLQAEPSVRFATTERVRVERLDTILDALGLPSGEPAMLKVDVQGFESQVISGAGERLAGFSLVMLECSLRPIYQGERLIEIVLADMRRRGFHPVHFYEGWGSSITGEGFQYDVLFAPTVRGPITATIAGGSARSQERVAVAPAAKTRKSNAMRAPIKTQTFEILKARGIPVQTILDVGVLGGTPELISAYPGKRHVLFEPVVEFAAAIHDAYAKVDYRLVSVAVSDTDGVVGLRVASNVAGVPISHSGMAEGGTAERLVPMVTLDKHLSDFPEAPPFLLKIDIDGEELRVLRGAADTLKEVSVAVIETPIYAIAERIAEMQKSGFVLFDLTEPCYYDEALWQCDAVFLRSDLKDSSFKSLHPDFDPKLYVAFTG